jgi:hypothetical protein
MKAITSSLKRGAAILALPLLTSSVWATTEFKFPTDARVINVATDLAGANLTLKKPVNEDKAYDPNQYLPTPPNPANTPNPRYNPWDPTKTVTNIPNAVPDDGIDDTDALNAALQNYGSMNCIIYLPNGTYNISKPLNWAPSPSGISSPYYSLTILQGESRDGVIIQLNNSASGPYQASGWTSPNADDARWPVIMMSPISVVRNGTTGKIDGFSGAVSDANRFRNAIRNLTINTGTGNAQATAVFFNANNQGTMRDVKIVSGDGAGKAGIDCAYQDQIGPALFKNVSVDGFKYGVRAANNVNGLVFENLTLTNQTTYGMNIRGQIVSIRGLLSTNTVPAVNIFGNAVVTIVDSDLGGGSSGNAAITAIPPTGFTAETAKVFVRNTSVGGYGNAVSNNGTTVAGPLVQEYASHSTPELFSSPDYSLHLPVQETPVPTVPANFTGWVNVESYGANGQDTNDDATAIQNAFNASGATVVYFPNGVYKLAANTVITIPSNITRVIGFEARVESVSNANQAKFKILSGSGSTLFVERLAAMGGSVINLASRPVVFSHVTMGAIGGAGYTNVDPANSANVGTGEVYFEDVVTSRFYAKNQRVWARQLNNEADNTNVNELADAKLINDGGQVWILGYKTEKKGSVLKTINGGSTEVLGAHVYATGNVTKTEPMLINGDGTNVSVTLGETATTDPVTFVDYNFSNVVEETRGGTTDTLIDNDVTLKRTTIAAVLMRYTAYASSIAQLTVGNPPNFQVQCGWGAITYNSATGLYERPMNIKNNTGAPIKGPLIYGTSGLTSGVTLINDGTTSAFSSGTPFVYVDIGSDNEIADGETVYFTLSFAAPNSSFSWSHVILAGFGVP